MSGTPRSMVILLLAGAVAFAAAAFDENIVQEWPKNTAIKQGEEGRLNCSVKTSATYDGLNWQFVGDDTLVEIYAGKKGVRKVSNSNYKEVVPTHEHDIATTPAKWAHAGQYRCTIKDNNLNSGHRDIVVTVTDKVSCTNGGQNDKKEGEYVNLDCQVKYKTSTTISTFVPDLKWYDESGQEIRDGYYVEDKPVDGSGTTPKPLEYKMRTYRLNKTASGDDDGKKFTCRVSFTDEHNRDYEDVCETSYNVQYSVTGLMFEPDYTKGGSPLKMKVGEHINCTAKGNPEPKYLWTKVTSNGKEMHVGDQLEMTKEMVGSTNEYKCKATNKVQGQEYNAELNVKFDVTLQNVNSAGGFISSLTVLLLAATMALYNQL